MARKNKNYKQNNRINWEITRAGNLRIGVDKSPHKTATYKT
jgi:hypothetical protein